MGEYAGTEGELDATGMRFAIVAARFNHDITEPLCAGAEKALRDHGAAEVSVVWVPGAFELPLVAKRFAAVGHGRRGGVHRRGHPGRDRALRVRGGGVRGGRHARIARHRHPGRRSACSPSRTAQQAFDRVGGSEGHKGEEAATHRDRDGRARSGRSRDRRTRYDTHRHVVHAHPPHRTAHRGADCTPRSATRGASSTSAPAPAATSRPTATSIAVEPSPTMIAQRPPGAAPVVRARRRGPAVPRRDASTRRSRSSPCTTGADPRARAARSCAAVARRQVFLSFDAVVEQRLLARRRTTSPRSPRSTPERAGYTSDGDRARALDVRRVEPVLVPADCVDGFAACYWNRPEAYVDPDVQAGISWLARLDPDVRARGTEQLRADLASGAWDARHGHLRGAHRARRRLPPDCRGRLNRRPLP